MEEKWVAIDFDGTLVVDAFPNIGDDNPHAVEVVKRLRRDGCKIALNTCRQGIHLQAAVEWMVSRGITPDGVNDNPYARAKWGGNDCKKVYADVYIDDHSIGIKKTSLGSVDFKYIKRNYKRLFT